MSRDNVADEQALFSKAQGNIKARTRHRSRDRIFCMHVLVACTSDYVIFSCFAPTLRDELRNSNDNLECISFPGSVLRGVLRKGLLSGLMRRAEPYRVL